MWWRQSKNRRSMFWLRNSWRGIYIVIVVYCRCIMPPAYCFAGRRPPVHRTNNARSVSRQKKKTTLQTPTHTPYTCRFMYIFSSVFYVFPERSPSRTRIWYSDDGGLTSWSWAVNPVSRKPPYCRARGSLHWRAPSSSTRSLRVVKRGDTEGGHA